MLKLSVPISMATVNERSLPIFLDYLKKCDAERVFLCGMGEIYSENSLLYTEAEHIRSAIRAFKEQGLEVGIWVSAFGHGVTLVGSDAFKSSKQSPYVSIEGVAGGDVSAHGFCPSDESFMNDYAKGIAAAASLGPDIVMLDDDFRIGGRRGYYFGCFCPKHLARFYELVGEEIPRDRIEEKIFSGGKNKYRDAYRQMISESMLGFAKRMREAVDSVDPRIRLGVSGTQEHWDGEGLHLPDLVRTFSGDTKPFFRTCGAPYWSIDIMKIIDCTRCQNKWLHDEGIEDVMAEGDTYPRPRYNVPFKTLELFNYVLIADEYSKGMLGYIFDYVSPPEYETGYAEKYVASLPTCRTVDEIFRGKKAVGITVINEMHKIENWEFLPGTHKGMAGKVSVATNPSSTNLLCRNSIPTSWNENGYPLLIMGENARRIEKDSLKNGAILDVHAARILTEKGIDVGFIRAEKTTALRERYVQYNDSIPNVDSGALYKLECRQGANVLSFFLPEGAPASYLYENADGMRFYVLGFDDLSHYSALNGAKPMYNYLNNYYRQQELMEAIEWMCGKPLPVKCQKNPNLYVYAAKDENAMSVMLLNIHLDSIDHPVLELDREYTEIKCVNCSAEIRGKQIYLSDVQGYSMAAFEVK